MNPFQEMFEINWDLWRCGNCKSKVKIYYHPYDSKNDFDIERVIRSKCVTFWKVFSILVEIWSLLCKNDHLESQKWFDREIEIFIDTLSILLVSQGLK